MLKYDPRRVIEDVVIVYNSDLILNGFQLPRGEVFERRKFSVVTTADNRKHLVLSSDVEKARAANPRYVDLIHMKIFRSLGV